MMMYRKRTSVSNHNVLTALDMLFYRGKKYRKLNKLFGTNVFDTEEEIATL